MEEIYLRVFKRNISLGDTELLDNFVHVIGIDRLQLMLAEEFYETDMLKMFEHESLFKRIAIW